MTDEWSVGMSAILLTFLFFSFSFFLLLVLLLFFAARETHRRSDHTERPIDNWHEMFACVHVQPMLSVYVSVFGICMRRTATVCVHENTRNWKCVCVNNFLFFFVYSSFISLLSLLSFGQFVLHCVVPRIRNGNKGIKEKTFFFWKQSIYFFHSHCPRISLTRSLWLYAILNRITFIDHSRDTYANKAVRSLSSFFLLSRFLLRPFVAMRIWYSFFAVRNPQGNDDTRFGKIQYCILQFNNVSEFTLYTALWAIKN